MPSASERLFAEMGLDPFGHEPDYMPPKPPSKSELAKLGDKVDRLECARNHVWDNEGRLYHELGESAFELLAEREDEIGHRFYLAQMEYGQALTARVRYLCRKAQLSKRRVKSQDRKPLDDARFAAERHLDLIDAAGPDFSTKREFIDAHAAHVLASDLYEIAEKKFDIQEREARADKRAGIVRHRASRIRRN